MILDMKAQQIVKNLVISLVLLFAVAAPVAAAPITARAMSPACQNSFLTIPAWYNYLPEDTSEGAGECEPTLGAQEATDEVKINSSLAIGIAVLEGLLKLSSLVAFAIIIWGAFKFATTQGNPENFAKARSTIINAAIGFAIVLIAAQVVAYLGRTLGSVS